MEQEHKKPFTIKPHLVVGVIVLLFAIVALLAGVVDSKTEAVVEEVKIVESEFKGVDGSLTLFAFDIIAGAWRRYATELEEESEAMSFNEWLYSNSDTLPQKDTFQNSIKLRTEKDGEFVLWSEARDTIANTNDDYIKTYKYE